MRIRTIIWPNHALIFPSQANHGKNVSETKYICQSLGSQSGRVPPAVTDFLEGGWADVDHLTPQLLPAHSFVKGFGTHIGIQHPEAQG